MTFFKTKSALIFSILLFSLFVVSCSDEENEPDHDHPHSSEFVELDAATKIAASEIQFGDFTTGVNGGTIQAATVIGMLDGAHGTFIKIPVGEETVPHDHTETYQGIVVKGIVENPEESNTNPKQLPAGSFWYQPGGERHITRCADNSSEPCLTFIFSTGAFDFNP